MSTVKEKAAKVIQDGFEANQVSTMVLLIEAEKRNEKKYQERKESLGKAMETCETATSDSELQPLRYGMERD